MNALAQALAQRIARDGPLTFHAYMQAALYDPTHGYYATGKPWQGEGDFVTAPMHGTLLAEALAAFALQCKAAMGKGRFEVVEVGSGSGRLAAQLHQRLAPEGVRVRSMEVRRPPLLPREVPWSATPDGLDARGLLVSNELFDALPVHLVRGTEAGIEEAFVALEQGALALHWGPPSTPALQAHLAHAGLRLEPGQPYEVNLDAAPLLRRLASALAEGVVLTLDYGDTPQGLAARRGTLTSLRQHRLADPLEAPGEADLTAHVDFTALEEAGAAARMATLAQLPQWAFLGATGVLDGVAARLAKADASTLQEALAAKAAFAPGRMGDFRALVQAKGLPPAAQQALQRRLAGPRIL